MSPHLRCVYHQSVPLAFDVIILWLFSDVKTIKLQLSRQLFLSLKNDQWNLKDHDIMITYSKHK